jgi:CDP-glycerol glycerophosphotransferase
MSGAVDSAAAVGGRALRYATSVVVAARARLHPGARVPGLLSVVVPTHGVERYIDACLHSIRRQPYRNLEIVVVDDGSPDGSMAVAELHRRRDPRVRIVRRPNGGPSAARNTGVAAARGELLTFVDPDDLVRPEGFTAAISTLRQTGSDFAVLSYDRMQGDRRQRPGTWITAAHATRRLRCTVDGAPDIQVNAVVWSKVFRRGFYDAAGIRFPEGTIYEDQPVSARAYARAQSFDILTQIGVTWRIRDEGTSITQQTAETDNLVAHNAAVHASLAELDDAGHGRAADTRALQLLANNMRLFIRHADVADDAYWSELQAGLRELRQRVDDAAYVREVPAQEKVLGALIRAGDRERARRFVEAGGLRIQSFPTEVLPDGRFVARLPFHGDRAADVPADSFVLADRQLSVSAPVAALRWDGRSALVIEGWGFITNVDLATRPPELAVTAVDASGRRTPLRTVQQVRALPEGIGAHDHCDYRPGAFSASLELAELGAASGPWTFELEVAVPGLTRSGPLTRTAATDPGPITVDAAGARYEAGRTDAGLVGLWRVA